MTVALWALVGLALAVALPAPAAGAPVMTLLSERRAPGTEAFAQDLAQLWQRRNVPSDHRLALRSVDGGEQRLRMLQRGRGDFAIVSASVAYRRISRDSGLGVVAALWPEVAHAVTGEPALAEMSRHPGLPVLVTASAAYLLPTLIELQTDEAGLYAAEAVTVTEALQRAPRQVILVSGFAPVAVLHTALSSDRRLRLLRFPPQLLEELRLRLPWLHTVALPAHTYPRQDERLELPAQYQLLVGRAHLPEAPVRKMIAVLDDNADAGGALSPRFAAVERRINAAFVELMPYHPSAATAFGLARAR